MEQVDLTKLDDLNDIEHHETNDFEWIILNDTVSHKSVEYWKLFVSSFCEEEVQFSTEN